MEKDEEEKEGKKSYCNCGLRIADCGIKRFFRGQRSDDNVLNGPENDDEKNAELHYGKSPELHRTKGNGGKNEEKDENEFYKKIKHSHLVTK